jgi:hypothetical protein
VHAELESLAIRLFAITLYLVLHPLTLADTVHTPQPYCDSIWRVRTPQPSNNSAVLCARARPRSLQPIPQIQRVRPIPNLCYRTLHPRHTRTHCYLSACILAAEGEDIPSRRPYADTHTFHPRPWRRRLLRVALSRMAVSPSTHMRASTHAMLLANTLDSIALANRNTLRSRCRPWCTHSSTPPIPPHPCQDAHAAPFNISSEHSLQGA